MLRLTTLGATDLRDRLGHPLREVLAQPKRVALLVYLAVEGRRGSVSRDRLLGLFWPESDESRARNTLSQALHYLRQVLGPDVIESQGSSAVGIRAEGLWCDATAFVDALERGEVELALDLYRGEFCPTLFTSGTPEVEQWLDLQRRRQKVQAFTAARAMAEGLAARGDHAGAVRAARRALALEPDDEAEVRALITLLDQAGDRTGALHAYQEYARRLATSLETEPESETRRLVETIRRRPSPPATPAPPPDMVAPEPLLAPVEAAPPPSAQSSHPAAFSPPPRIRHRALLLTTLGLGLVVLAGAVTLRGREHPAPPPVRTIAVLPFTLRGGTPLAYLRDGMVDLLAAKLGDASGFQVIDPRTAIAATGDKVRAPAAEVDGEIARRLGAGWYISGEVIEIGGRLQLNGALHRVGGGAGPVATGSVVGDTAALFELVDELTGRMLAGLTAGRDTSLTRLAAVTTHSLPALKAFLEGERALREGRDAAAAAAFRNAASLDTGFALAQYRLALTATWVTVPEAANPVEWAAKAAQHAQRLNPLGRDLLNAYRAYKEVRADEAEQRYRALTEAHPDNVEAWLMLAETRFHYNPLRGRSPFSSQPAFRRVLTLDPGNLHAMIHLARLAAGEGPSEELDSLAERYLVQAHDAARGLEMRALRAYARNDLRERSEIAAQARDADDRVVTALLQAAMIYAQNFDAAGELADPFLETVSDSLSLIVGVRNLTELNLARGQWSREKTARSLGRWLDADWLLETESVLAGDPAFPIPAVRIAALRDSLTRRGSQSIAWWLDRSDPPLNHATWVYRLGLLNLRLRDTAAAERAATQLLTSQDGSRAAAIQLGRALRAELARDRGNLADALVEVQGFDFDQSTPWNRSIAHWGVRERFLKAELLRQLGRNEEALEVYQSFKGPWDAPYFALTHLRQGQIHQLLGHQDRARFHYRKFRELWRDADPEFAGVVASGVN